MKRITILALTGILFSPHVNALEVELAPVQDGFYYAEFDTNNEIIDEEFGVLPGLKLSLTFTLQPVYVSLNMSAYQNVINYNGQTQAGEDFDTRTDTLITRAGYDVGGYISYLLPRVFFGLNKMTWDRDIRGHSGVLGLHEEYRWIEMHIGFRLQKDYIDGRYWFEPALLLIRRPEMQVILPGSDPVLNLGTSEGVRLRIGRDFMVEQVLKNSLSLYFEAWSFGRSDPVYVNDFYGSPVILTEPESISIHAGVEFSFYF